MEHQRPVDPEAAGDDLAAGPRLELAGSRLFASWLATRNASLAFTTYQAGKVFFVGVRPDGRLSVFERTFPRCMGMGLTRGGALWLSSLHRLIRFENFLDQGERRGDHDALYVPVAAHTTGDIDVHDIHPDAEDRPVFAATRFNCLAGLSERGSFTPLWRPPFIDRLAAEDRCHLNGFCMRGGAPAYATCVSRSNVAEGWREGRRDGGVVIDVPSGEIVAGGLSMPHSPRLHDGRLWLIHSGTGEFGQVDLATGRFEPVCFLPGFARGVTFLGDHAIVGVSRPRGDRAFAGLALQERLDREGVGARCELAIVNLATGDVEHQLSVGGVVEELYDVAVLPGVTTPMALGFRTDEIRFTVKPTPL